VAPGQPLASAAQEPYLEPEATRARLTRHPAEVGSQLATRRLAAEGLAAAVVAGGTPAQVVVAAAVVAEAITKTVEGAVAQVSIRTMAAGG
jgi:hypothetical protein